MKKGYEEVLESRRKKLNSEKHELSYERVNVNHRRWKEIKIEKNRDREANMKIKKKEN